MCTTFFILGNVRDSFQRQESSHWFCGCIERNSFGTRRRCSVYCYQGSVAAQRSQAFQHSYSTWYNTHAQVLDAGVWIPSKFNPSSGLWPPFSLLVFMTITFVSFTRKSGFQRASMILNSQWYVRVLNTCLLCLGGKLQRSLQKRFHVFFYLSFILGKRFKVLYGRVWWNYQFK